MRAAALLALLLAPLFCATGAARAQLPAPVLEDDLKAAILYNFALFAEWPPDSLPAGAPLRLCAFQGNGLALALEGLRDKPVHGHRLAPRLLPAGATPVQLAGCHLLLLDRGDRERWPQLKPDLAGISVLTVADDRVIGADGAMISFTIDNRKVGFDVDLAPLRGARLSLSSKLLRLARSVQ